MIVPTWHAFSAVSKTGGADLDLPNPDGTVDGDLLLICVGATAAVTIPTGGATWNEEIVSGVSGTNAKLLWKNALSEPSSWTIPVAGVGSSVAACARISGHDPADPIDVASGVTGNVGNVVLPSVTPSSPECLLFQFLGRLANVAMTEPGGVTEHWDAASPTLNYRTAGGSEPWDNTASGSRTWVPASGTAGTTGFMVAVRPIVANSGAFLGLI